MNTDLQISINHSQQLTLLKDDSACRTQAEIEGCREGRGWNAKNAKAYRPLGTPDLELAEMR
jgi:hypothetical protein